MPNHYRRGRVSTRKFYDTPRSWKHAIAVHLHEPTDVSNGWPAQHPGMGSAAYVSKHLGVIRRHLAEPVAAVLRKPSPLYPG